MKAKMPIVVTYDYMRERVQYLDMLALMVLHDEFGFGAERLKRYYRAIYDKGTEYARYRDPKDPDWGKKDKRGVGRVDVWKLKADLMALGFDYDAMVDESLDRDEEERKGEK